MFQGPLYHLEQNRLQFESISRHFESRGYCFKVVCVSLGTREQKEMMLFQKLAYGDREKGNLFKECLRSKSQVFQHQHLRKQVSLSTKISKSGYFHIFQRERQNRL